MQHVAITPQMYAALVGSDPIPGAQFVQVRSDGLVHIFTGTPRPVEQQVGPGQYEAALQMALATNVAPAPPKPEPVKPMVPRPKPAQARKSKPRRGKK